MEPTKSLWLVQHSDGSTITPNSARTKEVNTFTDHVQNRLVCMCVCVLSTYPDGIILGMSSLQQLTANLDACEEGPLTEGKLCTCACSEHESIERYLIS